MLEKILLVIGLALPPAIFWGYFFYKKDKKEPEPLHLMIKAFFYGVGAAILVMLLQYFLNQYPEWNAATWLGRLVQNEYVMFLAIFMMIGFIEEYVKHFAVVRLVENRDIKLDQIIDGIEYSVAAALGFAFVENAYYFFVALDDQIWVWSFMLLVIIRSTGTMLAHTIFSGIFGYYYGLSKLLPKVLAHKEHPLHHFHRHLGKAAKFHILRHHMHKDRGCEKKHDAGVLVTEGLLLAGFLHVAFNFFNTVAVGGVSLAFLNVPLLMGAFWFLLKAFRKRRNLMIVKR